MRQGISLIYEEGLEELMQKNNEKGTLHFTTDYRVAYKDAQVILIGDNENAGRKRQLKLYCNCFQTDCREH